MKRTTLLSDIRGFTIIELLIVLAISGIVLAGAGSVYKWQRETYSEQEKITEMQQTLRAANSFLTRELREAKYSPVTGDGDITQMQPASVTFVFETDDDDGTLRSVRYDLYDAYADGDTDLGRSVDGAARVPIAENIDALEFLYLDSDGAQTNNPDNVVSIVVSILARSDRPEPDFLNTLDYFPASCRQNGAINDNCITGALWTPANPTWNFDGNIGNNRNAFDDNFRRRLLRTTIFLRN